MEVWKSIACTRSRSHWAWGIEQPLPLLPVSRVGPARCRHRVEGQAANRQWSHVIRLRGASALPALVPSDALHNKGASPPTPICLCEKDTVSLRARLRAHLLLSRAKHVKLSSNHLGQLWSNNGGPGCTIFIVSGDFRA